MQVTNDLSGMLDVGSRWRLKMELHIEDIGRSKLTLRRSGRSFKQREAHTDRLVDGKIKSL